MDLERWARLSAVVDAALQYDPEARQGFVAEACADDEALRHEVESLLARATRAEQFLQYPAKEAAPIPAGTALGPYVINALIGTRGMGQVYRFIRFRALKLATVNLTKSFRLNVLAPAASALLAS
jgi:hypothetical protein